jgi:hypothetical protein
MDDQVAQADGGPLKSFGVGRNEQPFILFTFPFEQDERPGQLLFKTHGAIPDGSDPDAVLFRLVLAIPEEQQQLTPRTNREHAKKWLDLRLYWQQVVKNEIERRLALHVMNLRNVTQLLDRQLCHQQGEGWLLAVFQHPGGHQT